jgi:RNA polymerase sigma-70 factor, ECF subfamily
MRPFQVEVNEITQIFVINFRLLHAEARPNCRARPLSSNARRSGGVSPAMRSRGSEAVRDAPLPQPPDERTDDELMRLAVAGDGAAYEVLVRRHQARLRAYCARWCGSSVVGDDLAQECFVELWQRRARYVPQGRFKAYLFHVAANRCKNQRRAQGRELALVSNDRAEDAGQRPPSSDRFLVRERAERVQSGLSKLPEPQREAVLLRYSAELDYAEMANLLDVSEATLRSRVFLGLMKLRRLLRAEEKR